MVLAQGPCTNHSSARFDRVFNSSSLLQEFKRYEDDFEEPYLWELNQDKKNFFLNPFRKNLCYNNINEIKNKIIEHRFNVKKIVDTSDILILTLGQSEIVRCRKTNFVFAQVPPAQIYDIDLHSYELLNENQNLENLNKIITILKRNIALKIILTVSPIPLRATYRKDIDSIQANFENKFSLIIFFSPPQSSIHFKSRYLTFFLQKKIYQYSFISSIFIHPASPSLQIFFLAKNNRSTFFHLLTLPFIRRLPALPGIDLFLFLILGSQCTSIFKTNVFFTVSPSLA